MIKVNIKSYYIEYIFLILLAVGFLDKSSYLLLILFATSVLFSKYRKVMVTAELIILSVCFFSFYSLYVIYYERGFELFTFSNFFIGPIIGYLTGQFLVEGNEKRLRFAILAICTMLLLHGAANLSQAADVRVWYDQFIPDIWNGERVSGTLNGAYFTGGIVLACFGLLQKKLLNKIILAFSVLLIFWSSLSTAERTIAANLILTIIFFLYAKAYFGNTGSSRIKQLTKNTVAIGCFILLVVLAFVNNTFGVQTAFMKTTLGERLLMLDSFTKDGRSSALHAVLEALWEQPMGNLGNMFYAHNLFVDIGRLCGIIPMMLMMIYILFCIVRMLRLCTNNGLTLETRMIMFAYYFSFLVNFMLEPILEGMPMIFIMFCIINGAVASFLQKNVQNPRRIINEYC